MKKIYCKIRRKRAIKEFIKAIFSFNEFGIKKCINTYKDIDCKVQECHPARRSFEDLLAIVKTVYTSVNSKTLASILCELNDEGFLRCLYCRVVNKTVYYGVLNTKIPEKFGYVYKFLGKEFYNKKGKSKYSLNDVLKLAGRKTLR